MAQPNFHLMSQSATTLSEQLALCENMPAIEGGAVILARLDNLTTRLDNFENQMVNQMTTQITNLRNDMTNQITNLTNDMTAQMANLRDDMTNHRNDMTNQLANLTTETRAKDTNATARLRNRTIADRNLPLAPLVNPRTGGAIPRFLATPAALSALSGQDLINILAVLDENVVPNPTLSGKKRMLRGCVGLVDTS
ncbi:MAG: hypothetical protein M1839_007829 [Geoglossum umbratile]|nr:MAG: hypothetical protein M1839_007829 [Geoglossum umbratile]